MKEGIKKKFCVTYYVNKVHTYREKYEKNIIETIVDNYGILCLNRRHPEEGYIIKICEKLQQNIIPIIESIEMN